MEIDVNEHRRRYQFSNDMKQCKNQRLLPINTIFNATLIVKQPLLMLKKISLTYVRVNQASKEEQINGLKKKDK